MDSRGEPRSIKRWLILVALFAVGYFDVGTMKSLGVFLEEMAKDLQSSLGFVGLAIGLCHSISRCFAVVNIPLLKRFSAGKLVFVGSGIAATAFSLVYFATSGVHFLILMLLVGFGYSTVIVPSEVSVIYFFPDHFEIASTIVLLGSGVGMMTLPLLTEQLVVAYSWRGAILVLGALNLNSCVTGLLMTTQQEMPVLSVQSARNFSSDATEDQGERLSLIEEQEGVNTGSRDALAADGDDDDCGGKKDVSNNDRLFHTIARTSRKVLMTTLETFDVKIFRDYPRFVAFCLTYLTFSVSYYGWIVFLIPNAEAKDIRRDRAVLLATIGGTANIFGRLLMGFQSARSNLKPHVIYCFICILSAGAFFCNYFTRSFSILSCLAAVNAFAMGVRIMSRSLLCKSIVSEDRFPAAMSLISFTFGIGETIGALFIGAVYNATKSFDIMFCVLGAANMLESCLIISPIIMDSIHYHVTLR